MRPSLKWYANKNKKWLTNHKAIKMDDDDDGGGDGDMSKGIKCGN